MLDGWPALTLGPTEGEDIETGGAIAEPVLFEKVERQSRQALLLVQIDRRGRARMVRRLGGAYLDEHEAHAVEGDDVQLAKVAFVIAKQDAVTEAFKESRGGTLRAVAEPAAPPRFAGGGGHARDSLHEC